MGTMGIEPM